MGKSPARSCSVCAALALTLALCLAASRAFAFETSFWVWQRAEPLSDAERAELLSQNVRTLFWHVGEMENRAGEWRWKTPPLTPQPSTPGLRVVPVIRLSSFVPAPFAEPALAGLLGKIRAAAAGGAAQLDMDCPDRLLGDYADALKKIHAEVPWLSITALAHWSRQPAWEKLQAAVDEIAPMFYDTEADPPVTRAAGKPLPLADAARISAGLDAWSACKIPWRAGLPAFARVTVYDAATGAARGHIRGWNWDDICFQKNLLTERRAQPGVTILRAAAPVRIGNTPLKKDDLLAARWPARAALASAIELAKKSGARGIVFFRLPDSSDASGWSLRQLGHLESAETGARLILQKASDGQALALTNAAESDLAPRLSSDAGNDPLDRGYALELDAPASIFREALAGDFWRVTSHAEPDANPHPAPIPLATRLTFWFSHLRAGETLRTGLIQLAPSADLRQLRYRVLHLPKGDSEWKHIEN